MKKVVMMSMIACGCMSFAQAQKIVVKADRELGTDFGKYKTFNWATQAGMDDQSGIYFLNDLIFKADVRDAIEHEMQGLGYRFSDKPDLIVNFRVYDRAAKIRGYEGYGQGYWGNEEYRQASDTVTYTVEPGTLLVSLLDRKQGTLVWQGFASGLINNDEFIKDDAKIMEAVNLIFHEYGMRAEDYDRAAR